MYSFALTSLLCFFFFGSCIFLPYFNAKWIFEWSLRKNVHVQNCAGILEDEIDKKRLLCAASAAAANRSEYKVGKMYRCRSLILLFFFSCLADITWVALYCLLSVDRWALFARTKHIIILFLPFVSAFFYCSTWFHVAKCKLCASTAIDMNHNVYTASQLNVQCINAFCV